MKESQQLTIGVERARRISAGRRRVHVVRLALRHTFSSDLLAVGIPLIEVSAWMGDGLRASGHEITNTTTRVDAHATGEAHQAALDELAPLIAAPTVDANSARHESV